MRLGWNRAEDGVITVYAHASDGRVADVADFWIQPLIDRFGMKRDDAKEWQQQFAEMLVEHHNRFFTEEKMTREINKLCLAEYVARRMLSDMEEHGGVDEFCEKMCGFPEQYLSELALGAVDCVDLSGCLHSRVVST